MNDLDNFFKLTPDYIDKACKVAGRAFQNDPVIKLTYPNEKERKQKAQYFFEMVYRYGIKYGEVYATSNNLEGISVWIPPNRVFASIWDMIKCGALRVLRKSGLKAMKRGMPVMKYMESAHKRLVKFDHWYLQELMVKPEEQGKGYGSLLLKTMFKKIDSEGLPIYVDTNNEKNIPFYQKHGFEILEHVIHPKTNIPVWGMLRKPM